MFRARHMPGAGRKSERMSETEVGRGLHPGNSIGAEWLSHRSGGAVATSVFAARVVEEEPEHLSVFAEVAVAVPSSFCGSSLNLLSKGR